jgi:hypothetical protein
MHKISENMLFTFGEITSALGGDGMDAAYAPPLSANA